MPGFRQEGDQIRPNQFTKIDWFLKGSDRPVCKMSFTWHRDLAGIAPSWQPAHHVRTGMGFVFLVFAIFLIAFSLCVGKLCRKRNEPVLEDLTAVVPEEPAARI